MIEIYTRCTECNHEEEQQCVVDTSGLLAFECTGCSTEYCTSCSQESFICDECKRGDFCKDCIVIHSPEELICNDCMYTEESDVQD